MSFPNIIHGDETESLASVATQAIPIGAKMIIEDGRAYRHCLNNSSNAMIVANMQQAAVPEVAKYGDQAIDTLAAGVTVLTGVGADTTNLAIDELIDGYCWSEQPAQLGPAQRTKSNTLITQSATTGTITLHIPLAIAIGGSDTISYIRNTWRNVLIMNATPEAQNAGVSVAVIATSEFGWVQVSGPCKIQTSGTILVNDPVTATGATAGEVKPSAAATDPVVGHFMSFETNNEDGLFFLIIE